MTYLFSSSIFTLTSLIYFIGSIITLSKSSNIENIMTLIANIFYVFAYISYIKESKQNEIDNINVYEPINSSIINKKNIWKSYIISSALFTITSIIYFILAMKTLSSEKNSDNIISFFANLTYCIAYITYIIECFRDHNNPKALPFITRPFNGEATHLLG